MSNILNSDQDRHFISLDSGQDRQNVSPGLDLNCLQFWLITYFIEPFEYMKITLDISIIIIIITQHQKESFNNSENLIDYY